jgi:enoyl-CoA hydratase
MDHKHILFKVVEGIATITFNRPKVLNALNSELLDEFANALEEIAGDENIRILILTGAGEKAFVAGADIKELASLNTLGAKQFSQTGHRIIQKLQQLPIPVIAAVNGFALGGGTEIALACDFIYASENATFGQPEINLGLIPGFGGTQRLSRLVGINLAKEMLFTGKLIPATEAYRTGIVNKVCSSEDLMKEVMAVAKTISQKGKVSLRAAKQAINQGVNVDLATGCAIEIDAFAVCIASEDAKEGTTAFLEKRKPIFQGNLTE